MYSAFLLKHRKIMVTAALIALLVGVLAYYKVAYNAYKGKFESAQIELRQNAEKFEELAKGRDALLDRLYVAQKQVEAISAREKTRIVTITKEFIPQECSAAMDFAIENRGDLTWND
jgi:hypothetical protein